MDLPTAKPAARVSGSVAKCLLTQSRAPRARPRSYPSIRSKSQNGARRPFAHSAARITVSSMPLTMPTSCIPIYPRCPLRRPKTGPDGSQTSPSCPSRAVMTTRAMASEIRRASRAPYMRAQRNGRAVGRNHSRARKQANVYVTPDTAEGRIGHKYGRRTGRDDERQLKRHTKAAS